MPWFIQVARQNAVRVEQRLDGDGYHGRTAKSMKIFQSYNPQKVAKYVKILFRGHLYIKDVGAFEFDKGKILLPKVRDQRHFNVMSEVNQQVSLLQAEIG